MELKKVTVDTVVDKNNALRENETPLNVSCYPNCSPNDCPPLFPCDPDRNCNPRECNPLDY